MPLWCCTLEHLVVGANDGWPFFHVPVAWSWFVALHFIFVFCEKEACMWSTTCSRVVLNKLLLSLASYFMWVNSCFLLLVHSVRLFHKVTINMHHLSRKIHSLGIVIFSKKVPEKIFGSPIQAFKIEVLQKEPNLFSLFALAFWMRVANKVLHLIASGAATSDVGLKLIATKYTSRFLSNEP